MSEKSTKKDRFTHWATTDIIFTIDHRFFIKLWSFQIDRIYTSAMKKSKNWLQENEMIDHIYDRKCMIGSKNQFLKTDQLIMIRNWFSIRITSYQRFRYCREHYYFFMKKRRRNCEFSSSRCKKHRETLKCWIEWKAHFVLQNCDFAKMCGVYPFLADFGPGKKLANYLSETEETTQMTPELTTKCRFSFNPILLSCFSMFFFYL